MRKIAINLIVFCFLFLSVFIPFVSADAINSTVIFYEGSSFGNGDKSAFIQLYRGLSYNSQYDFNSNVLSYISIPVYNRDMSTCDVCSCKINIHNPDGSIFVTDGAMSNTDGVVRYSNSFKQIGIYDARVDCSDGVINGFSVFQFKVGYDNTLLYAVMLIILFIIMMGVYKQDLWFMMLGGIGVMIFGLYTYSNGLFGTTAYRFMSIIIIAFGVILSMRSGMSLVQD